MFLNFSLLFLWKLCWFAAFIIKEDSSSFFNLIYLNCLEILVFLCFAGAVIKSVPGCFLSVNLLLTLGVLLVVQPKNTQVCQICSDDIGKTIDGEPFVACHVCAFPVCRPCYEYERKDGNHSCPQCKTKYKRHKG